MNQDTEIRNRIRKISGTLENDSAEYAIGIVTEINPFDSDLANTCKVKLISSKSITGEIYFGDGTDLNGNNITEDEKSAIKSHYANGLILNNVALCVSGGTQSSLSIPSIGSNVIVMMSRYQQPFIAQFSNIEYNKTTYGKAIAYAGNDGFGNDGFGWSIINDDNYLVLFENVNGNSVLSGSFNEINLGTKNFTLQLNNNLAEIGFKNGKGIQLSNGNIVIIAPGTGHIAIKNDTESLNSVLHKIATCLTDISNIVVPSGGGALAALAPSLVADISTAVSAINNLLAG